MSPAELMDTPRIYTALAEWAACLIYILILKKKISGFKLGAALTVMLGLMAVYQYIAGLLPLYLWIPGMLGAIGLMYLNILLVCDISRIDAGYCCIRAFVLAEFAASFQWQIYVWLAVRFQKDSRLISILVLLCSYTLVYVLYYFLEKAHMPEDERLIVGPKEFVGAASIAIGAFIMSNISFVMPDTPFSSATSSILYVRTLVDFGGLVMLFAQQDKREEFRMRSENQAMNIVLQRQYDQYRLAQDNMELLRREFHDLKHYLIAIRSEDDPAKREQYLFEMENAILTQEALADTGNHVLDVVLTTKSTYCIQKNITFNCMADGKLLNFMHVKDICSIFGNALDNAIECVGQFENPEQRLITMDMYQKNHFLMIQFENYSENKLVLKDRFPITTKGNKMYHGYGLKSIQFAVQKYGGTMTVRSEGNWFKLHILIPID